MVTRFDLDVLDYHNEARENPMMLTEHLSDLLTRFDEYLHNCLIWPSGHKSIQKEGKVPIIELIEYIKHVKPVG